jgi:transcriptional antiterminator RfaH
MLQMRRRVFYDSPSVGAKLVLVNSLLRLSNLAGDFSMTEITQSFPRKRWYVVETAARKEHYAAENLKRQSFSSLFLRFRKTRRHARRVDQVLAPVFPGYIFVAFDEASDPWSAINGTFGVKRLVGVRGTRPQPMPDRAICELLARCDGEIVRSMAENLQPGQTVRLIDGPFADQWATVEQQPEADRVCILLNVLGRDTRTSVSIAAVARA